LPVRKSLDLVGDGDELELIIDVEEIFAIKFTDAELEACRTAGDLNDIVWQHLSQHADAGNSRCMSAMAFHALRRSLVPAGAGRKIRPSDRLDGFAMTPKDLSSAVRQQTGLTISFARGRLGRASAWLMLAAVITLLLGIAWHALFIVAGGLYIFARVLSKRDSGSFEGCEIVANAVTEISASNFGRLAGRGANFDPKSTWQALRKALSRHGDCPEDEIGPGTLLIHA
jgi:hypothetical protein